jgi:hypothetical protein
LVTLPATRPQLQHRIVAKPYKRFVVIRLRKRKGFDHLVPFECPRRLPFSAI